MAATPDVLIIGGGVVGSACALELVRSGRSVTVVEPERTVGQAWRASAGLLSPQLETAMDPRVFALSLAGREYYRGVRDALEQAAGHPIGLTLSGILQLATSDAAARRMRDHVGWQVRRGLRCDWLSSDQVRERWPDVGANRGALWAPEDGYVDPARLVPALIAEGARLGVRRVQDHVTAIEASGDRVVQARGSDSYRFGDVVLAAGAWSGQIEGLPRPIPVEPIRGQMAALSRPRGLPDLVVYGEGHYLLTRSGEVACGAMMEHVGFAAEVTSAGIAEVLQATARLCPALLGLAPVRTWAGFRPGTPDGLPIIGPEPRVPNLWYATGHGRNGILLGGITGVELARLMAGEPGTEGVAAFRPERFQE